MAELYQLLMIVCVVGVLVCVKYIVDLLDS